MELLTTVISIIAPLGAPTYEELMGLFVMGGATIALILMMWPKKKK